MASCVITPIRATQLGFGALASDEGKTCSLPKLQVGAGSYRMAHPRSKDRIESPTTGSQQKLPAPAFHYASHIFKLNSLDAVKNRSLIQTAEFSQSEWWIFFAALVARA